MKATDLLISQHMFLRSVFSAIDRAVLAAATFEETSAIAGMTEALLRDHAVAEERFLFAPLDNSLQQKGQLSHLASFHQETVGRLRKAQATTSVPDAQRLVMEETAAIRHHFRNEERAVVPLANDTLNPMLLERLGGEWLKLLAPLPREAA